MVDNIKICGGHFVREILCGLLENHAKQITVSEALDDIQHNKKTQRLKMKPHGAMETLGYYFWQMIVM